MEVEILSTKKVDTKSRTRWTEAIDYGERLLAKEKRKRHRARLQAAIEWFKHQLETGAPYEGFPISESEAPHNSGSISGESEFDLLRVS